MTEERAALLDRMRDAGGGSVALEMEVYDVLVRIADSLERIAAVLEAEWGE